MAVSVYQFLWMRSIPVFSGLVALATLLGLGVSLVTGSAGLLLLARQRDRPDHRGIARYLSVYGFAKAILVGFACAAVGAGLLLIVANIMVSMQQLPPPMKPIVLAWSFYLMDFALGFLLSLGDNSRLRPRRPIGIWAVILFSLVLPIVVWLSPGIRDELKLYAANAGTILCLALLIGYYGEKVAIIVQRHSKACGAFLILSAIVLVGVTLMFKFNPPL